MSVAAGLAVILPLAIVSYHIGDLVPVATATTPNTVNANAPAPTAVPAAPRSAGVGESRVIRYVERS